jgi:hypothetical protein
MNKYKDEFEYSNKLFALKLIHLGYQLLFFSSIIVLLVVKYNSKIHYYILIFWLIIIFHWMILKGECIVDLIEKKILNKNYKIGEIIVFLVDFNYNLITKKITKYLSSYYNIKFLKLVLITLALFKININNIYKIMIFSLSLLCLWALYICQKRQSTYINSLNRNHKIFNF